MIGSGGSKKIKRLFWSLTENASDLKFYFDFWRWYILVIYLSLPKQRMFLVYLIKNLPFVFAISLRHSICASDSKKFW